MGKRKERRPFADAKTPRLLAMSADSVGREYVAAKPEDETVGIIACICIDGPLAQQDDGWFDNYESIASRYALAMGDPSVQAVILKFNSPGGDVAGLFECATAMRKAKTKPVMAYVDEACYSAAYALAMVADTICLPAAGGCGSVGVITCMVDISEMNAQQGVRVEVITSGTQKADGHPDVPLTDGAIARTQSRVDDLATMFFGIVAKGRNLSPAKVKGFQAGIFIGQDAVDAGLADQVMSWNDFVTATSNFGRQTTEAQMAKRLSAAIRDQNEKALALAASASPTAEVKFKHTKKMVEVLETEDDPNAAHDSSDSSSSDSSSDSSSAADSSAPPPKKKGEAALMALLHEVTGKRTIAGATGALMAMREAKSREATLAARVETLELERKQDRVAAMVRDGMKSGKLSPAQKSWAQTLSVGALKAYLEATPSMVHGYSEALITAEAKPRERKPTAKMIEIWKTMGFVESGKPGMTFADALNNMDQATYDRLENR